MWLEQAVFTSTKSRQGEGYHVVAKSPGVSSGITTALNRRCPSHGALQGNASDFESLNFHRLTPNTLAVSRTVYGGKEYSNRGGLQVVTIVLVVKDFQLEGYVNDPFCLARMARSLGHLRWQPQFPSTLPSIELPDMELTGRWTPSGDCYENSDKALQHWYGGGSVAVVSEERAEEIIGSLLRASSRGATMFVPLYDGAEVVQTTRISYVCASKTSTA